MHLGLLGNRTGIDSTYCDKSCLNLLIVVSVCVVLLPSHTACDNLIKWRKSFPFLSECAWWDHSLIKVIGAEIAVNTNQLSALSFPWEAEPKLRGGESIWEGSTVC